MNLSISKDLGDDDDDNQQQSWLTYKNSGLTQNGKYDLNQLVHVNECKV